MFKLYLIKEFQRLKAEENDRQRLEWSAKRFLSKNNYHIHTDAVKNYELPRMSIAQEREWIVYADEADLLNVALFHCTAKQWREANPELSKGQRNIRDFASINELTVLSNLETHNAQMIREGLAKAKRFEALREIAAYQLRILDEADKMKRLPE